MQPQATGIKCLLKRLMPTVGCEADAQTFHEETRHLLESTDEATQHAILSNGSYTTASSLDLSDQTKLRLEHCLMTAEKKRIRLVQHVAAAGPSDPWQLSGVEVHHEYYDGPYNGGASLSGCGGGMSNFAELDKFGASQLQHDWTASSGSSYSVSEDRTVQLQHLPSRMSSCSQEGITCLPLNAYSIVQSRDHGELLVEAGVLQKNHTLLVAQQTFDNGHCKAMSLGTERVQS
ncbi:hypothetical protein WJX77_009747 [Trebouxia sp. C0004]